MKAWLYLLFMAVKYLLILNNTLCINVDADNAYVFSIHKPNSLLFTHS